MLTNQPDSLGKVTAFQERPFHFNIDFEEGYVIDEPVLVEIWTYETMVDNTTPVIVDGQNVSFTFEVEQLREFSETKIYLKFDGDIKLASNIIPTMDPAYPSEHSVDVVLNDVPGIVKVSVWSDRGNALLAQQAAADAEAARDETIEAMVEVSDRVPKFLNDLANKIMLDRDTEYTDVSGALTSSGGATGTTVNTGTKAITITSGNSGSGAFMRQAFDLSVFDEVRITDKINILVRLTETESGTITSSSLGVRLYINGVLSGVTSTAPALYDAATKTWQIQMQPAVGALTDEYEVEVYMKVGAPVQAATTVITWIELGANQDKYVFEDAVDYIDESLRALDSIRVTFDDQPVVTAIDMTGLTDVTAAWQEEIDRAINTSGKWLGRVGTPMVTAPLNITGQLVIEANGMDVNVAIPTPLAPTAGAELFFISTVKPVKIYDLLARRLIGNPSHQPTWCRFDPLVINKGSKFERCAVYNMPRGMTVDYCDGLEISNFYFGGGQFYGLRAGYASPLLTTNLKVHRSSFDTYLDVSAQVASLNGFEFLWNDIFSTSGSTFSGRGLDMAPGTGTHKNVRVLFNKIRVFREYGIALIAPNGSPVNDILIGNNFLDDRTPDATDASSRPIHIAGNTKNITMIDVLANHIFTKEIGIWMDNARLVGIHQNKIARSNVGGVYATSQGIFGSNLEYLSSNNALYDLAVASSFVSSTTHTTI
jgi:hypothetical protein